MFRDFLVMVGYNQIKDVTIFITKAVDCPWQSAQVPPELRKRDQIQPFSITHLAPISLHLFHNQFSKMQLFTRKSIICD